jgi:hypothetical protein
MALVAASAAPGVSALAQRAGPANANGASLETTAADAHSIAAFRKGFEVSVEGSPWARSRTFSLPTPRCKPATSSPCVPGTPALLVKFRFPSLVNAVDLSQVLAKLGEAGGAGDHYMVRPVPANATSPVCAGGFTAPAPFNDMHLAINLGNPGTPLPVTCKWTVLAGVPNPTAKSGVELVWSDTVAVHLPAAR